MNPGKDKVIITRMWLIWTERHLAGSFYVSKYFKANSQKVLKNSTFHLGCYCSNNIDVLHIRFFLKQLHRVKSVYIIHGLFWSKCGKINTRIIPNTDTFYAVLPEYLIMNNLLLILDSLAKFLHWWNTLCKGNIKIIKV